MPESAKAYGEPITAETLPPPAWGPRQWTEGSGRDGARPLEMDVFQALYPLRTSYGLNIGVRVTIGIGKIAPAANSYATAEVFDGMQWHAVAGLPAAVMRSRKSVDEFDDELRQLDTARLLEDVRLAHALRAFGSNEIAEQNRVVISHEAVNMLLEPLIPPAEPVNRPPGPDIPMESLSDELIEFLDEMAHMHFTDEPGDTIMAQAERLTAELRALRLANQQRALLQHIAPGTSRD